MPYVDYKTPIESKINWVQGISFVIQALTLALNHEWVVANPRATLIIGMVINALTAILRTFFPTASTTWAMKAAVLLALTLALSASPAYARPVRVCDGTACKIVDQPEQVKKLGQWIKAMPLPRVIANPFRAMWGNN